MYLTENKDPLPGIAQVAISKSLLEKLLSAGAIHSSECRCLNSVAKSVIWNTLLKQSMKQEY